MSKNPLILIVLVGLLLAPLQVARADDATVSVTNSYIVTYKDDVPDAVVETRRLLRKATLRHEYNFALKGFSAELSSSEVERLKSDPRVADVVEDRLVELADLRGATDRLGAEAQAVAAPLPQGNSTGLSRVGINTGNNGSGIGVAILDTGIDLAHPDLAPNIIAGKNCVRPTAPAQDDNGHGTHVAGIVAALDNNIGVRGVAPAAKLISVKVLSSSGYGSWSSILCGIDWVTANAAAYNIKVANMSLTSYGASDNNCGYSNHDTFHQALCRSSASGIAYVVAAGNNKRDTKGIVPAAYEDTVITVTALADSDGLSGGLGKKTSYGADDTFASFSNYGAEADLAAPGVDILSTYTGGKYKSMSGTSMASPFVAGAAALYVSRHGAVHWSQIRDGLKAAAEAPNAGHTDPLGRHGEPLLKTNNL